MAPIKLTRDQYNEQWHTRSYALRRNKCARPQSFDVEQALGQSVAEAEEQYGTSWADVLNNGAAAKVALRSMRKARGKARGGLVSMYGARDSRPKRERHVQRREIQHTKQELRLREAHAFRVEHIERLKGVLPLARIRKFARKTRAYRRAYREEAPNSLADVERLVMVYKSHRSADVFDKKFCHGDE